ncbi:MAG: hypothetical protein ACRC80_05060 [Waterburya sp.]
MINLNSFGVSSFSYFPQEVVESNLTEELEKDYQEYKSILHTDDLYDTSKIQKGMLVTTNEGFKGIITSYHLTDLGQLNGAIEVKLLEGNKDLDYYYAHQLKQVFEN